MSEDIMYDPNEMDVNVLASRIAVAKRLALQHFNATAAASKPGLVELDDNGDISLARPSYFVEFTDIDKMKVTPSIMGEPFGLWFSYTLLFNKRTGEMTWCGLHPVWNVPLPPLVVDESMYKKEISDELSA